MIKCNLAVLLAERGLKMSDVINDTPLSKTAVRGLYYNTSKGIQFETLETICDYLNVEPGDVIKNFLFNYDISDKDIDIEDGIITYHIGFNFDDFFYLYPVSISLIGPDFHELFENDFSSIEIAIRINYEKEVKQDVLSQITTAENEKFENKLIKDYIETFNLDNHVVTSVSHFIE